MEEFRRRKKCNNSFILFPLISADTFQHEQKETNMKVILSRKEAIKMLGISPHRMRQMERCDIVRRLPTQSRKPSYARTDLERISAKSSKE